MREIQLGYIGQRRSSMTGAYILGNGYRCFNPVLKRFSSWDKSSPFGLGGKNGYGYCQGNPINFSDLSGHGPIVDALLVVGEEIGAEGIEAGVDIAAESGVAAAEGTASGADAVMNMQLSDLPREMQEAVFEYLSDDDLVNVESAWPESSSAIAGYQARSDRVALSKLTEAIDTILASQGPSLNSDSFIANIIQMAWSDREENSLLGRDLRRRFEDYLGHSNKFLFNTETGVSVRDYCRGLWQPLSNNEYSLGHFNSRTLQYTLTPDDQGFGIGDEIMMIMFAMH